MEVAAAQLGQASTEMARRVYARFTPRTDEIRRWEKLADARDSELVSMA
jgi:hypothetical protein